MSIQQTDVLYIPAGRLEDLMRFTGIGEAEQVIDMVARPFL